VLLDEGFKQRAIVVDQFGMEPTIADRHRFDRTWPSAVQLFWRVQQRSQLFIRHTDGCTARSFGFDRYVVTLQQFLGQGNDTTRQPGKRLLGGK
jgi:hypothetical protein